MTTRQLLVSPSTTTHPFAGVDVTGQSLLHIGTAGAFQPNTFRALRNGIITTNTQAIIENSIFEDILRVNSENSGFFFALPAHGIAVFEHGIPHLTEAVIEDNLITALGAADNGMWMQAANHYRIENNTIGLSAQPGTELEHAGILLEGVRHSQVLNNTIEGNSTNNGIGMDVFGSSDVFYDCNTLSNLHTGARFGGECNGTELQATTFITPMRTGLHYLPGLTVEPPTARGQPMAHYRRGFRRSRSKK